MVDANSVTRTMDTYPSASSKPAVNPSLRNSLQSRQSQSSDSGHSEQTNHSVDRLKQRFEAGVELIKNLPTKGAFQPADSVKLRFYALYKQATVGPNKSPKPAFYDLVAKYKWEAWNSLGFISKENAMQLYIDELIKAINEMPKFSSDDSGLEAKLAPYLNILLNKDEESELTKTQASDEDASGSNEYEETESESEEFSDAHDPLSEQSHTETQAFEKNCKPDMICARGETGLVPTRTSVPNNGNTSSMAYYSSGNASFACVPNRANNQITRQTMGGNGNGRDGFGYRRNPNETNDTIAYAILNLQRQVDTILARVNSMESKLNQNLQMSRRNTPKWWPLDISPSTTFLLICWPFIAQYMMNKIKKRNL